MTKQEVSSSETKPLLSEDAFQNEQSRRLFEAIDELRSCGANHDIDLPELVIVGDQSAGKSSLLQSLTDIPFPVSDRLCTRFPTRIVSRRTPYEAESIKISIEPSLLSPFAHPFGGVDQTGQLARLDRYAKFTRVVPDLAADGFKKILNEAVDLMGIPRPSSSSGQPELKGLAKPVQNFSHDVLKVEISGPSRSYFSILDLPGIFQSLTKDLTEVEKLGVRNMSASYMTSTQSVIICVASGTNDIANQAVFDLASEKDPKGERTVGVITKCDIAQHPNQLMDLARNTEKYFRHGWFMVRNRTPTESQDGVDPLERQVREANFFSLAPWNALPSERRGTDALKKYLAELLANRTLETFPTMLTTLRDRIKSTTLRLERLGSARGTLEEKRAFLTKIAQQFSSLALQALRGRYDSFAANNLKLRRLVREMNDQFSSDMKTSGHAVPFLEQCQADVIKETARPTSNSSPVPQKAVTNSPQTNSVTSSVRGPLPFSKGVLFPSYSHLEDRVSIVFENIYMTGWSKSISFEELRLSDYAYLQNSAKNGPTSSGSGFGQRTAPSSVIPNGPFKTGSTELFKPSPAFGQSGSASSPFGFSPAPATTSADSLVKDLDQNRGRSEIYRWIALEVQANRGTELQGTFNPDILPALFHKQITKWKAISESHFLRITEVTVQTLIAILCTVCPDPLVRGRLEKAIRRASDAAEKGGLTQLFDRLDTLASAHLQTNHSSFVEKVRAARLQRFQAALERYRSMHVAQLPAPQPSFGGFAFPTTVEADTKFSIDMRDAALLFNELHVSNTQNLADEIHDILKAYYEIARDDFIEYITHLIVEPYLNGPDGPVMFFSPLYVSEMSPEQLETMAVEPVALLRERTDLESVLARLKRAEAIAQKYS